MDNNDADKHGTKLVKKIQNKLWTKKMGLYYKRVFFRCWIEYHLR